MFKEWTLDIKSERLIIRLDGFRFTVVYPDGETKEALLRNGVIVLRRNFSPDGRQFGLPIDGKTVSQMRDALAASKEEVEQVGHNEWVENEFKKLGIGDAKLYVNVFDWLAWQSGNYAYGSRFIKSDAIGVETESSTYYHVTQTSETLMEALTEGQIRNCVNDFAQQGIVDAKPEDIDTPAGWVYRGREVSRSMRALGISVVDGTFRYTVFHVSQTEEAKPLVVD
jgi:hypothetical protein